MKIFSKTRRFATYCSLAVTVLAECFACTLSCAAQSPNRTVAMLQVRAYVVQVINAGPVERLGVTTPGSHEAQLIIDLPTSDRKPIEIDYPLTKCPWAGSADLRGSVPNTSGALPQTEFTDGALLRTYTYVVK